MTESVFGVILNVDDDTGRRLPDHIAKPVRPTARM